MSTGQNTRDKSRQLYLGNKNSVCRFCTAETGGSANCHSTCEKYIEELAKNRESKERVMKTKIGSKPIRTQHHLPKAGGYFKEKRGVR